MASSSRESGRDTGKPIVRNRDAVRVDIRRDPFPPVPPAHARRGTPWEIRGEPRTYHAKPFDLDPGRSKPGETLVEDRRVSDVQLLLLTRAKG